MGELINRGRNVDAIEVATLNSEIHPYIWNTWYNLAAAQNAAGPHHGQAVGHHQVGAEHGLAQPRVTPHLHQLRHIDHTHGEAAACSDDVTADFRRPDRSTRLVLAYWRGLSGNAPPSKLEICIGRVAVIDDGVGVGPVDAECGIIPAHSTSVLRTVGA